jgi:hypothetical protein
VPAAPFYPTAPGRWVGEDQWPSPRITTRLLHLDGTRLAAEAAGASPPRAWSSPDTTGLVGGEWCPYGTGGNGPEFPGDQREDDGRSLTWDGHRSPKRLEILGAPVVELELEVDRPSAFLAVRLCDVRPDGASTRVSFGVLNLSHRDGHTAAEADVAGTAHDGPRAAQRHGLRVPARPSSCRLALSTQYWPMVWPFARTGHADPGRGRAQELPVSPPPSEDAHTWPISASRHGARPQPPRNSVPVAGVARRAPTRCFGETLGHEHGRRATWSRLERTGRALALTGFRQGVDRGTTRPRHGPTAGASSRSSAMASTIRVSAELGLSCTTTDFALAVRMAAQEDETVVWTRDWDFTIPRDNM